MPSNAHIVEIVCNMKSTGLDLTTIMKITGLSEDEIQKLTN